MKTRRVKLRGGWRWLLVAITANGMAAAAPGANPGTPTVVTIGEQPFVVYPGTLPAGRTLPSPGTTTEGQEYVVVRTAAGAAAIVLVTVENGPLDRVLTRHFTAATSASVTVRFLGRLEREPGRRPPGSRGSDTP